MSECIASSIVQQSSSLQIKSNKLETKSKYQINISTILCSQADTNVRSIPHSFQRYLSCNVYSIEPSQFETISADGKW